MGIEYIARVSTNLFESCRCKRAVAVACDFCVKKRCHTSQRGITAPFARLGLRREVIS